LHEVENVTRPLSDRWLRPSLLDRLTDHQPESQLEEPDAQRVDQAELRRLVRRDLSWLFNTTHAEATTELGDFPEVARSVLNFGMPDLTGRSLSSLDTDRLTQQVASALLCYESRLIGPTLKVRVLALAPTRRRPALSIEVTAELRTEPLPVSMRIRAEVDLESGNVVLSDDKPYDES
jgi:type VI secretion system protein ImpF